MCDNDGHEKFKKAASVRDIGGSGKPRGEAKKIKETFSKIAFFGP